MVGRDADAGTAEQDGVRLDARGPGATGLPPATPAAPTLDDRVHRELQELPLPALRRRRDLLGAEVQRTRHWTRLVRARRDLLVATVVELEDLVVPVEAGAAGGPLEALLGVGDPFGGTDGGPDVLDPGHDLRVLCLTATDGSSAPLSEQLQDLSAADRRLREYETALVAELALATEVFVERCTALFGTSVPAAVLDPSRG